LEEILSAGCEARVPKPVLEVEVVQLPNPKPAAEVPLGTPKPRLIVVAEPNTDGFVCTGAVLSTGAVVVVLEDDLLSAGTFVALVRNPVELGLENIFAALGLGLGLGLGLALLAKAAANGLDWAASENEMAAKGLTLAFAGSTVFVTSDDDGAELAIET